MPITCNPFIMGFIWGWEGRGEEEMGWEGIGGKGLGRDGEGERRRGSREEMEMGRWRGEDGKSKC